MLATFMFALQSMYRSVIADNGASMPLQVTGEAGGLWTVQREANTRRLPAGRPDRSAACDSLDQIIAWRPYIKGIESSDAARRARIAGDEHLGKRCAADGLRRSSEGAPRAVAVAYSSTRKTRISLVTGDAIGAAAHSGVLRARAAVAKTRSRWTRATSRTSTPTEWMGSSLIDIHPPKMAIQSSPRVAPHGLTTPPSRLGLARRVPSRVRIGTT